MENNVEARLEYGGLILTCDEESLARLYSLISAAEPSVAEAAAGLAESPSVRFISISESSRENGYTPAVPVWLALIPCILCSCISGVALIVGFVTIARWLIRLGN